MSDDFFVQFKGYDEVYQMIHERFTDEARNYGFWSAQNLAEKRIYPAERIMGGYYVDTGHVTLMWVPSEQFDRYMEIVDQRVISPPVGADSALAWALEEE